MQNLKTELKIKRETEDHIYTVFIVDNTVAIEPPNILLLDTIQEMVDDIDDYDINYLRESIGNDRSLYPVGMI